MNSKFKCLCQLNIVNFWGWKDDSVVKSAYYCCRGPGSQHHIGSLELFWLQFYGIWHPLLVLMVYLNIGKQHKSTKPCIRIGSNTLLLGYYSWMSIIHFESSKTRNVRLATTLWHVYNYLTCFVCANIYNFKVEKYLFFCLAGLVYDSCCSYCLYCLQRCHSGSFTSLFL